MLTWNLDPVLVSLGSFEIRWYGLVYALGFLLGYYALVRANVLSKKDAEQYLYWLIVGSIVASRLFYVFVYNPAYYLHNPAEILAVWKGGLSIHGGVLGAALATWWFSKKKKMQFYAITDVLVIPLALALTFGRVTNYLNGELWGTVTSVPWCVQFPGAEGCRHPSQLYEALYSYILFAVLFLMHETKKLKKGVLFWTFITLYGALRFIVTFFRELDPTDPGFLSLGLGQWLSLGMVLLGASWFLRRYLRKD